MNGIICIDKPQGITSFDVVRQLRRLLAERKIGHAGTLDPMATGVLPVFFGNATKAIDLLPCQDKRYIARVKLGVTTDTGDITGKILTENKVALSSADFEQAALSFIGQIEQVPPMYSALKVEGRRLYDLAREGVTVERKARPVTIYELKVKGFYPPDEAEIEVYCSKGTYIRTLCEDIGAVLGCGATMSALRRVSAGGFEITDCFTIEKIVEATENGSISECILDVEYPFGITPEVFVTSKQATRFQNGGALSLDRVENAPIKGLCRVKAKDGQFIGLAEANNQKRELKIKCLFAGGGPVANPSLK